MRKITIVVILMLSACCCAAGAEDIQGWRARFKKVAGDYLTMPAVPLPSMPDLSMPDFSKMSEGIMGEFNSFNQQIAESLPVLEDMGYEVTTFRVQWGIPPKAKLRLRSNGATDPAKISTIVAQPLQGTLSRTLVSGAAEAKRIQELMKLGAVVLDVDFALPPKVKISFSKQKSSASDSTFEDLDLTCAQALN